MEIEARFRVASKRVLDRVAALDRVGSYLLEPDSDGLLRTLYLDTPTRDLHRAAVALRIRRNGRRVEATVKLPGSVRGAIHRRPEWTVPLARMPRFPYVPEGRLLRHLPARAATEPLHPVVETVVRRRTLLATRRTGGGIVAEIAVDEVEHRLPAGRRRLVPMPDPAGYFEIEIELRAGAAGDLGRIVRSLRRIVGLRSTAGSKLERALRWEARARRASPQAGSAPRV